ncbi:Cyclic nucleotide-binding domain-containing protein [Cyclobacterium lianum]|uniref:Cyclic nucleotide-binding domain-containing protein n=1 Tax=Cyclobacterium lianum TaxID=388280 RepID=A0A1M7JNQ7_9BACT|nr:cyclic nucleotide-binding domain-containing protein [Cyclobacterium lianum]SHM54535.1 Cyclic nucleotide-binding domain-containing protein [Cyclobacterium lianum]
MNKLNPFRKKYSDSELQQFAFLRKIPYFKELSFSEMSRFLPAIHQRKYERDEVVFFRNDPSQALYILEKGEVTLNIDIRADFETIIKVNEGRAFGENSLLENSKRIYTAIVNTEEALLWVIPNYAILDIFQNNQKIRAKMMTALASYYNQTNQQLFTSYRNSYGFFNLGQMFE